MAFRPLWHCFLSLGILLSGCSGNSDNEPSYVKIGTGAQTGVYYAAGLAIADIVNREEDPERLDVAVEATDGSVYNINAVVMGALDFGMAQSDRQYQAYRGLANWDGRPQEGLRFVCSLHPEMVALLVAEDAGAKDVKDLKGLRISLGSPASGSLGNAQEILKAYGLDEEEDLNAEYLKATEASLMLQDGRIDGFFYTSGHPNGLITEATNGRRQVRFIPITGVEALLIENPYYQKVQIPGDMYPQSASDGETPSIGMLTCVVSSDQVSDEVVYRLVKDLFENLEDFKSRHPSLATLTPELMVRGAFAPTHPGALKFYREKGLTPDLKTSG